SDRSVIMMLGLVMFLGTAAVFWFSGGGIISSGEPCTEFDGAIEESYFDQNGICIEEEWRLDAEERFVKAQTMAFSVFVFFQLFNVLNCRSTNRSIFELGIFNNKAITISFAISSVFLLFLVQGSLLTIPIIGIQIGDLLAVVPLELEDWLIIFATASSVFFFDEVRKLILRSQKPRKHNR
ncbi:MAG TPA: cation-translocating P-type ATPase C-terminal domain-containing protein, partial [Candidatus Thalassarchaeaceae archaeon]|nr:cation-translocating P-type ATPase C-terminal domain-containing protein [Candidatus Thalassarchaeaceae archaeon]